MSRETFIDCTKCGFRYRVRGDVFAAEEAAERKHKGCSSALGISVYINLEPVEQSKGGG